MKPQYITSFKNAKARPRINALRVAAAVILAETIGIGSVTFEVTQGNAPTAGRVAIDVSTAASLAAAAVTGTFTGQPTAGQTITIAGQVYTARASLTAPTTANEFVIGGDVDTTINNLVAAIMKGDGGGTVYGSDTVANAAVTAANGAGDTIVLTAKVKGTGGNSIAVAETLGNFTFAGSATNLSGGTDTSASDFTTLATAVINATEAFVNASRISANEILINENRPQPNPLACVETLSGANNGWAAAAMFGGAGMPSDIPDLCITTRVASAAEVALATLHTVFIFPVAAVVVQVRVTSTGAPYAFDGNVVISGNRVTLSGGSNALATTHTVTLLASA